MRHSHAIAKPDGEVSALKPDLKLVKLMIGFVPAFQIAILLKRSSL